ncbi:MAG: hypothetical protein FWH37_03555 [Candidatus Bathyarchaeota archaeon]|nr:hypothetical protein [Candidatus Termiticorpusculum sp.]
MGHHPRTRTSKREIREYRKVFREKSKSNKNNTNKSEEKTIFLQQEIFEITLKRLHTLGNQKFGSSPFSQHFNRWLQTIETILDEFEKQSLINIDDQFREERKQILDTIKLQLEKHQQKEADIERQINNLSGTKNRLQQTNKDYLTKTTILKNQKATALKQLNRELEILKNEQDQIVKLKTGFFRGISKKEREEKEALAVQRYMDKQQEYEVIILHFKEKQKQLKEKFENKREPLLEDIKKHQKYVKEIENDTSLEERWFTCEALKDMLNNFLQRK